MRVESATATGHASRRAALLERRTAGNPEIPLGWRRNECPPPANKARMRPGDRSIVPWNSEEGLPRHRASCWDTAASRLLPPPGAAKSKNRESHAVAAQRDRPWLGCLARTAIGENGSPCLWRIGRKPGCNGPVSVCETDAVVFGKIGKCPSVSYGVRDSLGFLSCTERGVTFFEQVEKQLG